MKKLFLILTLITSGALAEDGDFYGLATEGHWNVSGEVSLNKFLHKNAKEDWKDTQYIATPSAKYFVANNVSIGARADFFGDLRSTPYLLIGPAGNWYFLKKGRVMDHLGIFINKGVTNRSIDWAMGAELGMDVFITPSVSVGPTFTYTHFEDNSINNGIDDLNLTIALSAFF